METQLTDSRSLMNDLRRQVTDYGLSLAARLESGDLAEVRAKALCRQQAWVLAARYRLTLSELTELRRLAHETAGLEE